MCVCIPYPILSSPPPSPPLISSGFLYRYVPVCSVAVFNMQLCMSPVNYPSLLQTLCLEMFLTFPKCMHPTIVSNFAIIMYASIYVCKAHCTLSRCKQCVFVVYTKCTLIVVHDAVYIFFQLVEVTTCVIVVVVYPLPPPPVCRGSPISDCNGRIGAYSTRYNREQCRYVNRGHQGTKL